MYRLEETPTFRKDLSKLDQPIAEQILKKLHWLAEHPDALRFPLKHMPPDLKGLHKYRVGDYRILVWPDYKQRRLILYGVEHRRSIYNRL